MKRNLGILISGRGSNMQALVQAARHPDAPYRVALVASDKSDAPGIAWAAANGLPTFTQSPKGMAKLGYEARIDAALRDAGVEAIALAGYMRLLSDDFVARWRGRIVNIHPSLLPKYKGLDTHARAIEAGDSDAGCSVHLVTEELDGGELLGQAQVPILPGDTPDTLAARVLTEEHKLYPRIVAEWLSN
jgi:phosphoribosylglycinamide formyltransferase 1